MNEDSKLSRKSIHDFPLSICPFSWELCPQKHKSTHIVQAFFSAYLVNISQRALGISTYRSPLFFFIPAKSSTAWNYYNLFGSFPTKKAFEASGIINNPPDLTITNRIANLWPYASCIVLSTLQVRWSPFIMVTVLWGTYYCHFTDKEQHSGYLSQVTKKMTKQALSPSLTQSPHPSRVP